MHNLLFIQDNNHQALRTTLSRVKLVPVASSFIPYLEIHGLFLTLYYAEDKEM